ncbi:hypothetical protein PNU17_12255 [Turicibacter sanguinis]|nr:hypothetical protein [Turicibacter sanguinis]MDB8556540.1 hypothetical protein [Turicibacter sanguinis]
MNINRDLLKNQTELLGDIELPIEMVQIISEWLLNIYQTSGLEVLEC